MGTKRPQAATIGASHQAHLVADAAARMLVDHRSRQRQALPFELCAGRMRASVSATRSAVVNARKNTAMAKAAT